MLTVNEIAKSYGAETLFENVTFTLNQGERVGLVGPNGCGKTTLLKILMGLETQSKGSFKFSPGSLRVGYLAQGYTFDPNETLGKALSAMTGNVDELNARLEAVAVQLANDPAREDLHDTYDQTLAELTTADESAQKAPAIIAAFGLNDLPQDLPLASLSGGQKTRLALVRALLSSPQLLLLDEPTNHLDIDMLRWLEGWLTSYPFAVLVVSHDRAFLDRITTSVIDMDPLARTTRRYEGNYSAYIEQKEAERDRQWQAYQDQQDEIKRLRKAATRVRSTAKFHKGGKADPNNTDGFSVGFFSDRGKETVAKAKQMEQRIERMLTDDRVEKPGRTWQMRMDFGNVASSGRDVMVFEDLSVGYGSKVLLSGINAVLRYGSRLALIGPNGAGKTTLLKTIAGKIAPLKGSMRLGANVHLGYMAQEQEGLDPTLTPLETMQKLVSQSESSVRALLSKFLFMGDDVFTRIGSLSYGERSRLTLACLVAQGCNFLLLDEPVNHLDIPSRAQFEQALANFEGTILAVVHDRYFIKKFATQIWEARDGSLREIYGLPEDETAAEDEV
jgi:ATP-binding cassette, subfamily F, member 3